jgi:hypothetical protein
LPAGCLGAGGGLLVALVAGLGFGDVLLTLLVALGTFGYLVIQRQLIQLFTVIEPLLHGIVCGLILLQLIDIDAGRLIVVAALVQLIR